MPKPLSTAGLSLTEVYGSVAEDLKRRIGDAQAAQAGPPVSEPLVPNTEQLQVDAWNARDPKATDAAMQALAQQKYQEHIAAGMTPDVAQRATAEDLTHFRYTERLKLYTHGQVDFAEQAKEATRLAKLAARKSTAMAPPPPPSMPSAMATTLQSAPGLEALLQSGAAAPTAAPPVSLPELPLSGAGPAPLPQTLPQTPPPPRLRSGQAVPGGY